MKNISIFISYAWKDTEYVDGLDNKLQSYGYKVERDIRDAEYAQNIKEFMKRIRKTDYSIIVLSDNFLKSENCMREIFEFIKDENFKDRIIPVILESAKDIWGDSKGIQYTIYWKEKEQKFKEDLKRIDEESKGGYIEELKHISSVKDSIGDIIKIFRDMKMFDVSEESVENEIIKFIKKKRTIKNTLISAGVWILILIAIYGVAYVILLNNQSEISQNIIFLLTKNNNRKPIDGDYVMSEKSYKKMIESETNKEIVYSEYNDFDLDGNYEMFAIVGERVDDETISGEIWFANQKGTYIVEEIKYYWQYPQIHSFGNDMFIDFEEYFTTGSKTYLWGVKDGEAFQPDMPMIAHGVTINEYDEVVVTYSTLNAVKTKYPLGGEEWTGRTEQQYYYFWHLGSFREYGAIEIVEEDLLKIKGTEEIINYIYGMGSTINEIYYRNNDIVQINYQKVEKDNKSIITYYGSIMFRYNGKKIRLEDCEIEGGNFQSALDESLAVYPNDFDINFINSKYDSNNEIRYIFILVCCFVSVGILLKIFGKIKRSI